MNRILCVCFTAYLSLFCAQARAQRQQSVALENLTHADVRSLDVQVLVLPIGSCEPHGYHLPYANDTLASGALASRAAARANEQGAKVPVLPVLPYGVNVNLANLPRAQSLRPATMMAFVNDVVDTAEQQGIRKVVIVNGHGGNSTTLGATLRELFASHPKVFVALVEPWTAWADVQAKVFRNPGGHSGESETSLALALYPEKVQMKRAVAPRQGTSKLSAGSSGAIFVKPWKYLSDTTGQGDPTQATSEKGQALVDAFVERTSKFLVELSGAEITESFPY